MIVYFNFKKEPGNEPVKVEIESLGTAMPLHKMQYEKQEQENKAKLYNGLPLPSSKKQKQVLGLLIISMVIALITVCYTVWKDQRNTNPNDLFKDASTMKDFILTQVIQSR